MTHVRSFGRTGRAIAICSALALVSTVAACGGSPSGSTTSSTVAPASGGSSTGFKLSAPVKLGFLWEIQGESSVAVSDMQRGATLAVKEINAAGGVGGHEVTDFRQTLPPLDLQATVSDFLAAAGQNPTVMIGVPSPTQVPALARDISAAKIPVLVTDIGQPNDVNGVPGMSPYTWFLGNYDPQLINAGITYQVKDLGMNRIGIMAGNDSYGQEGVTYATKALASLGLKPFATQQFSEQATDLTSEVLAMKGANAVFNWAYPNPVALQLKTMYQQGMNIPTMTDESGSLVAGLNLAPADTLSKMSVAGPCNPANPSYSPSLATFVKAYQAAYQTPATPNSTWGYDGVYFAVRAIEAAKSSDPQKVQAAIPKVSMAAACGPFKADGAHILNHQATIITFSSLTAPVTSKVFQLSPTPAGG